MKKQLLLTALCLSLALLLAACGGDDDDDSGDSKPAGVDTSAPAGKENVTTVDMKNIQYVPQEVTVRAGATIQWTNSDSVAHTVTKVDGPGPKFDSKNIDGGETYERNFPNRGTINYFCTIHPNQKGVIVVE